MKFSSDHVVVIPAYNEVGTLREIVSGVLEYCDVVIVVDDASTDGTAEQVKDLPITLLKNDINKGKAASLWSGIEHAIQQGAKNILTLDADGQHLPQDIPEFIRTSEQFPDHIIIGSRLADREAIPPKRYYANKVANFWISWACGYSILDSQSGFRLYPARLFSDLKIKVNRERSFVFESEILIKAAQRGIKSTPIKIAAIYQDDARPSHFRPVLDIVRITRMVAWSLISRLGYLPGLFNVFIRPLFPHNFFNAVGPDGIAMLSLSILVILLTNGISYAVLALYIFYIALKTRCAETGFNIIAIFGMKYTRNKLSIDYRDRLECAEKLLKDKQDINALIMGGVTTPGMPSEAEAGKRFLLENGIDEKRIFIEDTSRNTFENLRNALPVLEEKGLMDILVVTNRYHLARVAAQAKCFGYQYQLCAAEKTLQFNFSNLLSILKEGFYLHWFYVGKIYSHATRNKKMLARICRS